LPQLVNNLRSWLSLQEPAERIAMKFEKWGVLLKSDDTFRQQ
jgi:hypothetical protein